MNQFGNLYQSLPTDHTSTSNHISKPKAGTIDQPSWINPFILIRREPMQSRIKSVFSLLILLSISLLSLSLAKAEENVSGFIGEDTTWSAANSPYNVTSTVVINSDATLTIEAGVTLRLSEQAGILCNGTLVARGTSDQKIIFGILDGSRK